MRDLNFQITGVEAAAAGLTPLLHFKLQIRTAPATDTIQALLLNVQIQLQPPQRAYNPQEKERLFDLFGSPEQWGQTLRNRLWAHVTVTVGTFTGSTETVLPVPCTYDLNLAGEKYFYALEAGEVPLLFLFSGSLFYTTPEGRLQVERISWSKECSYRLPVATWQELMERLYPNCAWVYLRRDTFDRLYAYKRRQKLATWEETIEQLLGHRDGVEPASGRDEFHLVPNPPLPRPVGRGEGRGEGTSPCLHSALPVPHSALDGRGENSDGVASVPTGKKQTPVPHPFPEVPK